MPASIVSPGFGPEPTASGNRPQGICPKDLIMVDDKISTLLKGEVPLGEIVTILAVQ